MFGSTFKRRALMLAAAALVPLLLPVTAAATAPMEPMTWRMIDLGVDGQSWASAVNDRGHVVVGSDSGALLWQDGRLTNLGSFGPVDINNHDEVLGTWQGGSEHSGAVLLRHGKLTELGTLPGGQYIYPAAMNDRAEVVGWGGKSDGGVTAFLWRAGVLTPLGGDGASAADINNRGQIVGSINVAGPYGINSIAVRWWHGTQTQLTTAYTSASGINRFGTVVGARGYDDLTGDTGFVWDRGRIIEIPRAAPIPSPPGEGRDYAYSSPGAINGRGQVVGNSSAGPFVWEDGTMTMLPGSDRFDLVSDINEHGMITGTDVDWDPTVPEVMPSHAVIWIPVRAG